MNVISWFEEQFVLFCQSRNDLAKHFVLVQNHTLKKNVQKSNSVLYLAFCHPVFTWKEDDFI